MLDLLSCECNAIWKKSHGCYLIQMITQKPQEGYDSCSTACFDILLERTMRLIDGKWMTFLWWHD